MSSITNFPITVFGKKERFSDTMTRGRCRVFYTGHNRNGTYITEDFAKKLIASAPYTPVKGIYNVDDYTDHGKNRDEGRIYGIIPANPNFAWEQHEDENGIIRNYACFDVLYYTALYGEAKTINGKSESMELYRQTLKGSWQFIDGKKAYVFTEGCFLGLQVLGDDVEPCFEGAGFFSHQTEQEQEEESILAILEKYEKKLDLFQIPEQGGNIMNINFKLSDGQKHEILFHLLNPNFNEEGGWSVEYMICEVYDEYALVYKYEEQLYERVYYTKDDVEDKIEITNKERAYIIDVNLEEKKALDDLKGEKTYIQVVETIAEKEETISLLQGQVTTAEELIQNLTDENQTYTNKIAEVENTVNTLTEEIHNYGTTIGELENNISTLTTERDEAQTNFQTASQQLEDVNSELGQTRENLNALQVSYDELSTNYANIETERNELANFKNEVIRNQKLAVISNYTETLDAEIIQKYTNGMDEYSVEDLDMRLTYECKKANPTIFSKNNTTEPQPAYVPKEEGAGHGINDILARYEKK